MLLCFANATLNYVALLTLTLPFPLWLDFSFPSFLPSFSASRCLNSLRVRRHLVSDRRLFIPHPPSPPPSFPSPLSSSLSFTSLGVSTWQKWEAVILFSAIPFPSWTSWAAGRGRGVDTQEWGRVKTGNGLGGSSDFSGCTWELSEEVVLCF